VIARARLAALAGLAALAALAGCNNKASTVPIGNLAEPSSVAVFRGLAPSFPKSETSPPPGGHPYHPFFAVANGRSDDLTIIDAVNDAVLPATVPLHGLAYPVPFRPALVASADLGDQLPDLLVAVSAGDSRLKLVRTWVPDGAIVSEVDLGTTVIALAPLPNATKHTAQVVVALAGEKIAVVTYVRSTSGDGTGIDLAGTAVSGALGFDAVDLAVLPGDAACPGNPGARCIFAATPDTIPVGGGVLGVAEVDVTGTPFLANAIDARAPTRAVAAARYVEATLDPPDLGTTAFEGHATVERVYAVRDEQGCGFFAPVACGLVALDPVTLVPVVDPTPLGSFQAKEQAPIPLGYALGVATSGPPAFPPDTTVDPQYAVTWLRVVTTPGTRATTAVGAVSNSTGYLTYVDLPRWEVPSQTLIHANVKAVVSSFTPASGNQWLVLSPDGVTTLTHLSDPAVLSSAVTVTAGYTPTANTPADRWTVTSEGVLPGLAARRAQVGNDGSLWLAMQATDPNGASTTEVVRLFDPVLGVRSGDTLVFDATPLGTCLAFEASVNAVVPPDSSRFPGGAVRLVARTTSDPVASAQWAACLSLLGNAAKDAPVGSLRATIRAGGYVLVRGSGQGALHVGRPALGSRFSVSWVNDDAGGPNAGLNEDALAAACRLPPAVAWPGDPSCTEGTACRTACEDLVRARLARRVGYLSEAPVYGGGPALAFQIALEVPGVPPPRDLTLVLATYEGRALFRVVPGSTPLVGNGPVVAWDRSPYVPIQGVRFLAPYASGVLLDSTPTGLGGNPRVFR
jgi:hypothetical protein